MYLMRVNGSSKHKIFGFIKLGFVYSIGDQFINVDGSLMYYYNYTSYYL